MNKDNSKEPILSEDLLAWPRIHRWANKKKEGTVIGTSCTNCQCPLANYLHESTGKHWSVGPAIKDMGSQQRLQKPAWIGQLLNLIDECTDNKSGPIFREQFLLILDQVKP